MDSAQSRCVGASPLEGFHPAVAEWFRATFPAPTQAQAQAWPAIQSGRHVLVSAPTGSGKTLTAFLAGIDTLVRDALAGGLQDATRIIYVSPLKALSNDIHTNLELPLQGIREQLARIGLPDVEIRTAVRTGDTPQAERAALRRQPPHILVTTPESLYVLLGSESGRAMLAPARTVIVDEIHAVADDKRGSHLALSLERLEALCGRSLTRIGVSATQKPIEEVARLLVGAAHVSPDGEADCEIVDIGYTKQRDLALVLPATPLSVVMSNAQWEEAHAQIAALAEQHRTTLVFVNTRRMAERTARHLGELLGKEHVAAHHGSLAKELRFDAEQRLKRGDLKLMVATSSLELGIDIGDVDLVCQLGSPRAISAFLQRAGRAGHHVGGVPKARLFPASRDDLAECAALLDCVRRGELDALRIPGVPATSHLPPPLDVLAQQIAAEVASVEWDEDALYDWLRRAWPYRDLARSDFDAVVRMIAEGYASRRGVRHGLIHRDAVNRKLRGRQGTRMTAVMSGGTIPDTADYTVLLEPEALTIGSVNEDFAIESSAGDIFQLGNTSYRVLRVEPGRVRVEDAQGAPPTIPFWIGEAPGRTDELSIGVARLREDIVSRLALQAVDEIDDSDITESPVPETIITAAAMEPPGRDWVEPLSPQDSGEGRQYELAAPSEQTTSVSDPLADASRAQPAAFDWLVTEVGLEPAAAGQLVDYIAATQATLGTVPTRQRIVLERFFDESGGTQLVIHSPFGSRINRAWGLALRKRFCRKFNFELQAAATEDAIVLSLSTSHSFPLIEVASYLHSNSALDILIQALLDAPLFGVRWRWSATVALALPRFQGGKKVAPQLQRMRSEDLLASVFPDQVACLENIVGEREVPDHPLVAQTMSDCLYDAMDAAGWLEVLRGMESGEIEVVARDLAAPSPLAMEAINAKPYAFLDDAPLEERRTQAVQSRRYTDPRDATDLSRLDPDAIESVREQAWPTPRNADEMHEALQMLGFVTEDEAAANAAWGGWVQQLVRDQRATLLDPGADASLQSSAAAQNQHNRSGIPGPRPAMKLWICAERLSQLQLLFPSARLSPAIATPVEPGADPPEREHALLELVRGRLGGLGPVTVSQLASSLPVERGDIDMALLKLQDEGVAMQGHFTTTDATVEVEWCERHLLARIHRYTLGRLRREIEPVEPRDFVRFLCDWQKLSASTRVNGPDALAGVLTQLEGFEAPAAAWERELLPARVADYSIAWLDDQCTAGRTLWTRLRAGSTAQENPRTPTSVRAAPIVLLPRRSAASWNRLVQGQGNDAAVSSRAQRVLDVLGRQGASFFDDLVDQTRLLRTELEDALSELVSRGRIHCDSFAGLRTLLVPASRREARRGRRSTLLGLQDAGRWALVKPGAARDFAWEETPPPEPVASGALMPRPQVDTARLEAVEHVARTLLRRYGVVCWRLLEREAAWLPPWRELARVFHRLEARGEIRGGRFIAGLSGEQFALPEAVAALRQLRKRPPDGALICVCASDPLNLAGTLLAGDKVPRIAGARLVLRDGLVAATLVAGEMVVVDTSLSPEEQQRARGLLLRTPGTASKRSGSAPSPTTPRAASTH